MRRFYVLVIIPVLLFSFIGCSKKNPLESRVQELQKKIRNLQIENKKLKAELEQLKQTDSYYYQKAISERTKGNYNASNKLLKQLIERFPNSKYVAKAKSLIKQNLYDWQKTLYESALSDYKAKKYRQSNETLAVLLEKFPKGPFSAKAKRLQRLNKAGIERLQQELARKSSLLEVRAWKFYIEYKYAKVTGLVKNISNKPLSNVVAVVNFYDQRGNFIKSDSALIEYNPILPGQTSPFKVLTTANPAMVKSSLSFKFLMGGKIPTYYKK